MQPKQPVYLVVGVVDGEVTDTDDDFVEQVFRGMLGAVEEQGADDVSEGQRQSLGSENRLQDHTHTQLQSASTAGNSFQIPVSGITVIHAKSENIVYRHQKTSESAEKHEAMKQFTDRIHSTGQCVIRSAQSLFECPETLTLIRFMIQSADRSFSQHKCD